jgi:pimeloyl-ACP methyl ester carboxylesterase
MHLLLVHGMGRTPLSMSRLARELRRSGHAVHQLGYAAALESMDRIAHRVRDRLEALGHDSAPTVVIGHSLGGLLTRVALSLEPALTRPPAHLVMMGAPNQSPQLARRLRRFWPYRLVNGDAGQRLADAGFYRSLPPPPVPYTIIAGVGGRRDRWSLFHGQANDGLVSVEETRCVPSDRVVEVPARHTFLMNHREVRQVIHEVLSTVRGSDVTSGAR